MYVYTLAMGNETGSISSLWLSARGRRGLSLQDERGARKNEAITTNIESFSINIWVPR